MVCVLWMLSRHLGFRVQGVGFDSAVMVQRLEMKHHSKHHIKTAIKHCLRGATAALLTARSWTATLSRSPAARIDSRLQLRIRFHLVKSYHPGHDAGKLEQISLRSSVGTYQR